MMIFQIRIGVLPPGSSERLGQVQGVHSSVVGLLLVLRLAVRRLV